MSPITNFISGAMSATPVADYSNIILDGDDAFWSVFLYLYDNYDILLWVIFFLAIYLLFKFTSPR